MKYLAVFIVVNLQFLNSFSQKPKLNFKDIEIWPIITDENISNNGQYIFYTVKSGKTIYHRISYSNGMDLAEFVDCFDFQFTEDSKYFIFRNTGDSVCIFTLRTKAFSYISNVLSFQISRNGGGNWLAYELTGQTNKIVLTNLSSNTSLFIDHVNSYQFSPSGERFIFSKNRLSDSSNYQELSYMNLSDLKPKIIWLGFKFDNLTFSPGEETIAFISQTKSYKFSENAIWHYSFLTDKGNLWLNNMSTGITNKFVIANRSMSFSQDGNRLFFMLSRNLAANPQEVDNLNIHIWSYKDKILRSLKDQEDSNIKFKIYQAYSDRGSQMATNLQNDYDIIKVKVGMGGKSNYAISCGSLNINEKYLNRDNLPNIELINLKSGKRTAIAKNQDVADLSMSPQGRFVIWFEKVKHSYYTYEIKTGVTRNVSKNIPTKLYNELAQSISSRYPYRQFSWISGDTWVLIGDRFDIWKIDPLGNNKPINITNGFGRKNHIILRFLSNLDQKSAFPFYDTKSLNWNDSIILCAFNAFTKQNGFFKLKLNYKQDPEQIIMSSDLFYFSEDQSFVSFSDFLELIKAKYSDVYLLRKMNSREYPNLFVTQNFKLFTKITKLNPENNVNWIRSELIEWKSGKEELSQGIIYRPENFDPSKKYPVICVVYDQISASLNKYLIPEMCDGPLNIPYFVSNEYIIFCPDIVRKKGEPGKSVGIIIEAAIKHLKMNKWVDGNRIAIQGHSWGGYETNWLLTNTKLFVAGVVAAGISDLISLSSTMSPELWDPHTWVEFGQPNMGKTIWTNRDAYIRNSPIFRANKISAPLLMVHCKNDSAVPWMQAYELFTALRKLKKPAWLIQYDESGSGHVLYNEQNKKDYTQKLTDYFGYYLKGLQKPGWMQDYIN